MSSEVRTIIESEKKILAQLQDQVQKQEAIITKLELSLHIDKLQIRLDTFLRKVGAKLERTLDLQGVFRKYPLATGGSKTVTCIEFLDPTFATHFRSAARDFPAPLEEYEYRLQLQSVYDAFYQKFTKMYADFYSKMCTVISHPQFREHRLDGMVTFAPADYHILKGCYLWVTQYETIQLLQLHEKIFDPQPFFDLVSKYKLYDGKDSYHTGFSDLTVLHVGCPPRLSRTEKRLYRDLCQKVQDHYRSGSGSSIALVGDVKFTAEELELLKLYKIGIERISALRRCQGH